MKVILAIASKEWAEFRRDRLGLALAFVLPMITLLLFGFGVRLQAQNIPLLLRDNDKSQASKQITKGIDNSHLFIRTKEKSGESVEKLIQENRIKAAIEIPEDFEDEIVMDGKPTLKTTIDGSDIMSARAVQAAAAAAKDRITRETAEQQGDDLLFLTPHFDYLFNAKLQESLFIVSGVFGIILWMYPALLISVGSAREFEHGTTVQLQSANIRPIELLAGKTIVYFCVGMAEAVLVAIIAAGAFGLRLVGNPLPFVIATMVYILASVLFGLTIGTFTRSQTVAVQATATGGFFPSLLLSGFVYPISNIPFPLNASCALVPATYYIEICRDAFLRGAGWSSTWLPISVLSIFALVNFALAFTANKRMHAAL